MQSCQLVAQGVKNWSVQSFQIGFVALHMIEFEKLSDAQTLAQAIVNTIPEPFLVLDARFHVLAASVSFYRTFRVDPAETDGRLLYSLGDGQWDIPGLRVLLETIIPQHAAMEGFEVEHDFPHLGRKTMLLNAREVVYEDRANTTILLAFRDVTAHRLIERERELLLSQTEELLRQKEMLLQEMQHRVANSLQIIASILLMKARAVSSEETRKHLRDAHQRVMSVAEVQRHLHSSEAIDQVDVGAYLSTLCRSLASSMIGEGDAIEVKVIADPGSIGSDKAVNIGLIVTELVINAIKYAFPPDRSDARILVTYEIDDADWKLTVADNGVGKASKGTSQGGSGLGTAIVQALVKQLGAVIDITSASSGMKVSIVRATFTSHLPQAA